MRSGVPIGSICGVTSSHPELQPAECAILDARWRTSGLSADDLAEATGISVGAIRIALSGIRYRNGQPRSVVPPDQTLAKLAAVLGIPPEALAGVGRPRAATLLSKVEGAAKSAEPDLATVAAIAGRTSLARQILAQFSTEELRAELIRRDGDEQGPSHRRG